ncbi:hypothetical protein WN51_11904 [Melipona quadrifasciata]|uniref:Uncharacterized protein n=1 Tax=Melipona quadrifasciata TaxID=166423 RepID=A0A0N0BHL5_9HYME|nr:hypothetical protein WN51_11904 [Melipona quadrifasciata]
MFLPFLETLENSVLHHISMLVRNILSKNPTNLVPQAEDQADAVSTRNIHARTVGKRVFSQRDLLRDAHTTIVTNETFNNHVRGNFQSPISLQGECNEKCKSKTLKKKQFLPSEILMLRRLVILNIVDARRSILSTFSSFLIHQAKTQRKPVQGGVTNELKNVQETKFTFNFSFCPEKESPDECDRHGEHKRVATSKVLEGNSSTGSSTGGLLFLEVAPLVAGQAQPLNNTFLLNCCQADNFGRGDSSEKMLLPCQKDLLGGPLHETLQQTENDAIVSSLVDIKIHNDSYVTQCQRVENHPQIWRGTSKFVKHLGNFRKAPTLSWNVSPENLGHMAALSSKERNKQNPRPWIDACTNFPKHMFDYFTRYNVTLIKKQSTKVPIKRNSDDDDQRQLRPTLKRVRIQHAFLITSIKLAIKFHPNPVEAYQEHAKTSENDNVPNSSTGGLSEMIE